MEYIARLAEPFIQKTLRRNKSVLLLGARQTGKTTLLDRLEDDLTISFIRPEIRQRYEKDPGLLAGEVEALARSARKKQPVVFLDEIQKVPHLLDAVQDLIDRGVANFVVTGSSARKLRRGPAVNLLPGRLVALRLDPLSLKENPSGDLLDLLLFGSLPGIAGVSDRKDKETDLQSYVTTYLEEEVRAESIVRNLGSFARFLELAASESGNIVNFRKLSQEIGVSHTTIRDYYQILEDCLIAERIEPLVESKTRKKLTRTQKYIFFDLGVRRLAAREGVHLPKETWGRLFEQWVGLELVRLARYSDSKTSVKFWRDPDGPEVDWVLDRDGEFVPVEVKWTDAPSPRDSRHVEVFLSEYKQARHGYVICRTPRAVKLSDSVTALPWQNLPDLFA